MWRAAGPGTELNRALNRAFADAAPTAASLPAAQSRASFEVPFEPEAHGLKQHLSASSAGRTSLLASAHLAQAAPPASQPAVLSPTHASPRPPLPSGPHHAHHHHGHHHARQQQQQQQPGGAAAQQQQQQHGAEQEHYEQWRVRPSRASRVCFGVVSPARGACSCGAARSQAAGKASAALLLPLRAHRAGGASVAAARPRAQAQHPCVLQRLPEVQARLAGKRLAIFLDYDGEQRPWPQPGRGAPAAARGHARETTRA